MGRIQTTFEALQREERKALVAYLTAGDPDEQASIDAALCVVDNGADILEVGVPFSDPTADGPVIQRAMLRALQAGGGFESSMRVVDAIR
ncbi:MAG: tryptophan synthase subunit alpha, partial [Myxococcota bacterium]